MLTILATTSHNNGGFPLFKIIVFIYFIPTIVALFRSPIIKFKFFSVLLINLFFGWTVYGWWLSFAKAFSSRTIIHLENKSGNIVFPDKYEKLEKLNSLRSSGAINEEEFETEKKKILNH
ncbi:superinfection immunity protein [Chryseobacterium arthrosphaerae]|uniref:superinfection immunity protein n=1 Tax=Chryseobacterium arthrosphaerae TaxID=651561 RepID=UPI001F4A72C6|nr:superinfection immunity protein [Chryseobacterium arthrosphaerae]